MVNRHQYSCIRLGIVEFFSLREWLQPTTYIFHEQLEGRSSKFPNNKRKVKGDFDYSEFITIHYEYYIWYL